MYGSAQLTGDILWGEEGSRHRVVPVWKSLTAWQGLLTGDTTAIPYTALELLVVTCIQRKHEKQEMLSDNVLMSYRLT